MWSNMRIIWGNKKLYRLPKSIFDLLNQKNLETKTGVSGPPGSRG